ncbi:MAG TPA: hypothetical protein VJZ00_12445 [Thermoanaerobaculia bacterium]|nr:hypothetical protein [Thermoanaerobaculia bacterium]
MSVFAQERPPQRAVRRPAEWRTNVLEYEQRMQFLSKSVQRDAFIVGQMAAAMGDLTDFQKLTAIEKVRDRIQKAQQKAGEEPQASLQTLTALSQLSDTFLHAHDQGTMADTDELRKEINRQTHFIQLELFRELALAREELKNLAELIAKIHQVNSDLESAMVEALGTTFEFMRAGGK